MDWTRKIRPFRNKFKRLKIVDTVWADLIWSKLITKKERTKWKRASSEAKRSGWFWRNSEVRKPACSASPAIGALRWCMRLVVAAGLNRFSFVGCTIWGCQSCSIFGREVPRKNAKKKSESNPSHLARRLFNFKINIFQFHSGARSTAAPKTAFGLFDLAAALDRQQWSRKFRLLKKFN